MKTYRLWCLCIAVVDVLGRTECAIPARERCRFQSFQRHRLSDDQGFEQAHKIHFPSNQSNVLAIPRGGFNVATATATATSAFLGLNGGLLLVNPNAVLR